MDSQFKRNFLKGSLFTASGAVFSAVFHIITVMIIARSIPREDFGIYALIIAISTFLSIIAGMGLDLTLAKYVSEGKASSAGAVLMPVIILRATALSVVCMITFLCSGLVARLFNIKIAGYIPWLLLLCTGGSFRDLLVHLLQGLRLFKQYASLNILSAVIKCGAVAALLYRGSIELKSLIYVEAGIAFMTIAIAGILIALTGEKMRFSLSKETFARILKFTMPLYANNILTIMHGRMGIFMLGAMSSPAGVAFYEAASKIPDGFLKLFRSFITVYFPNQSRLFSSGKKKDALSIMNKSLGMVSAVILTLVLFAFLFKSEITEAVFSDKYSGAALAFALLMLNFYMRSVVNIMGYSLVSAGYSSVPMKVNAAACILNIGANLVLIPAYGFIGAVYSMLLMTAASQLMFGYHLARAGLLLERETMYVPSLLIAAMGIVCLSCSAQSITIRLMFVAAYLILTCILMKDLRKYSGMMLNKCLATVRVLTSESEL